MNFRHKLTDDLLHCDILSTDHGRERVIRDLPPELARGVEHSHRTDLHVQNMVDRCANVPGGLRLLLETVERYEAGSRTALRARHTAMLVDLTEIMKHKMDDDLFMQLTLECLPRDLAQQPVADDWARLLQLWTVRETPHPLLRLAEAMERIAPQVQSDLVDWRAWVITNPAVNQNPEGQQKPQRSKTSPFSNHPIPHTSTINTRGGAYIAGNVTVGGDFIGRDRVQSVDAQLPSSHDEATQRLYPLIDLLLNTAPMRNRSRRNTIVDDLPEQIRDTISRSDVAGVDVRNIVVRCYDFHAIPMLADVVARYEGDTLAMQKVRALVQEFVGLLEEE